MRRSKYGAVAVVVDGVRFHSQAEHRRWCELVLLQKGRAISGLARQIPIFLHVGKTRIGKYVADFHYLENGVPVYEDYKPVPTALSTWKLRHVCAEYGIIVRITGAAAKGRRAA